MPPEIPLIFNPRAGGGRGADLASAAQGALRSRGVTTALVPTQGPGGARPLAARLAGEGHRTILCVGGDGTISETVDGALGARPDVTLGFLPAGTGNSFLQHFDVRDMAAAAERIAAGKPRAIDVAVATWGAESRRWVNVFGVGFAARVADYANRRLKWARGQAYNLAVFPQILMLRSDPTRLVVDGAALDDRYPLVLICNTMFTGKGMKAAPMARADDGLLDVIVLKKTGRIGLLRIFPKIFDGSHVGHPRVLHVRGRTIEIEPDRPSPLLVDGEVYGRTPVRIETQPGALRALV